MENNSLENPWNFKLISYDGMLSENNCNVLLRQGIIGRFSFLKNMPNLFYKFDNLVLCNICQILVCKKSFFKHAKLHEKGSKGSDYVNTVHTTNDIDVLQESGVNVERLKKQTIKSPCSKLQTSKEKRRKVSEDKTVKLAVNTKVPLEDDYNGDLKLTNFVPKSTLNAANPLRIRIQLQPKPEIEPRNGNIFENLHNFYNKMNNNNLSQNPIVNDEPEIRNLNANSEQSTRMKEHNHTTTNRVITIQKYHPVPQHRSNSLRAVPTNSRPSGMAIVNHSMPDYMRLPHQTSSLPSQMRTDSPQLSQQPQVFQSFRQGTFPVKSSQKKYVEVKSLLETLIPVSSTQSLNSSINNLDQNQMSFQKILIENGMFSEEDIKRAQKPNFDRNFSQEIGHAGKIRRTSHLPVRLLHNNSINSRPRFVNNYMVRPCPQRTSGIIMSHSDPFIASQSVSSVMRNRNSQRYRSTDLSDDDFFLDQTLVDKHNVQTVHSSTSSIHLLSQYSQSNSDLPGTSHSQLSSINKNLNHQTTAQCPNDYNTDVHYLPPPEQTITSLSWEQ